VRAFVAVELGEEVRGKLEELQRGLPEGVRRVKPENLHLTLAFLGELDDAKVEEVKNALDSVSATGFELACKGVGAFPSARFVRVVWVGTQNDELKKLHEQVSTTLKPLGFKVDRFSAHVTIGRPKGRVGLADFLKKHEAQEFGSFKVEKIMLKKSTLTPGGPVYEDVFEKRLG